jgi:hypothetical protein
MPLFGEVEPPISFGGAFGKLFPFEEQESRGMGGRGQMSWRGSTVPHGVVVGSVHFYGFPRNKLQRKVKMTKQPINPLVGIEYCCSSSGGTGINRHPPPAKGGEWAAEPKARQRKGLYNLILLCPRSLTTHGEEG